MGNTEEIDTAMPVTTVTRDSLVRSIPKPATALRWIRESIPFVCILFWPVVALRDFWRALPSAGWPRGYDGSGHFALARIYGNSIFPDTFGWTHAFFMGMPFPNFYPPLFYWSVVCLEKLHVCTILSAIKLLAIAPLFVLPAAIWKVAGVATRRDLPVMTLSCGLCLVPLVLPFFHGAIGTGLNYFDTIADGIYSQPLAFVFLLYWLAFYLHRGRFGPHRMIGCALLFGAITLTNFFVFTVTVLLACSIAGYEVVHAIRGSQRDWASVAYRLAVPAMGVALALFWIVPMLGSYQYLVTRPLKEMSISLTPPVLVWYGFGTLGLIVWGLDADSPSSFLTPCWVLIVALAASNSVAPAWFPLQSFRLAPVVTYLLCIPAAYLLVRLVRIAKFYVLVVWKPPQTLNRVGRLILPVAILAFAWLAGTRLTARYYSHLLLATGFYVDPSDAVVDPLADEVRAWLSRHPDESMLVPAGKSGWGNLEGQKTLRAVLDFAATHRDGRYLVEIPSDNTNMRVFDSRAISSMLGAQGEEALQAVFREAALSSLFVNPQVNALSSDLDAFGISSILADDIDFAEQPIASHLRRVAQLGVRYLVVFTPTMRSALLRIPNVYERFSAGGWGLYEIQGTHAFAEAPLYRPALVLSHFSVKARSRNDFSFTRLAEEQFADGWFDVPLAFEGQRVVDELNDINSFGAVVLDRYDCTDCDHALDILRAFGATHPVIAIRRPSYLFRRLLGLRDTLPFLTVLDSPEDSTEPVLSPEGPTHRYDQSQVRATWRKIRAALDSRKTEVEAQSMTATKDGLSMHVGLHATQNIPVLLRETYNPRWSNLSGERVYWASPTFMLTFARDPLTLVYGRTQVERASIWVSAFTLCALGGIAVWGA